MGIGRLLIGMAMVLSGTFMYWIGETDQNPFHKCNKVFKTLMGIPIGGFYLLTGHYWMALMAMGTYAIATQFGYGDNNWLTKLIGKIEAICLVGFLLGLASFPILGWLCIVQSLLSMATFYTLEKLNAVVKEPWVAIARGVLGTICLL